MNKKIIYDLIDNKILHFNCNFQTLINLYNNNQFNILLNALKLNKSIQYVNFTFIQTQYNNEILNNEIIDVLLNPIINILKNKQLKLLIVCSNLIHLYNIIETLLINDNNIQLYIIYFKDKIINENEINNFKNKYSSRIINCLIWR